MESQTQTRLSERAAAFCVRHATWLLLVALVVVIAAHVPAAKLELDQSIDSMFPSDSPVRLAFERSRKIFGGDEFVFVAYEANDLYVDLSSDDENSEAFSIDSGPRLDVNPARLEEIKAFANELGQIPGVAAESTQDLGHMLAPDGENVPRAISVLLRLPTIAEKAMTFAEAVLVSPDRKTVGIALRLVPKDDDPTGRAETIARIREMGAAHDPPAIVVGEPVQLADTFRYIEQDAGLLGWSAAILLSLVIAGLFRRIRWVVLPLLVVYSALTLTEATLYLSGLQLSMVSSVLSALVTVIGIATVMHVIVHYRSIRAQSLELDDERPSREHDLAITLAELGPPVFWTCLTTALGFLALTVSSILPVRSFGIMMAIATFAVFVSTFAILPGGILIGRESLRISNYVSDQATVSSLKLLICHLRRFGWIWFAITMGLMAFATFGLFRLRVETDFSKNFRETSPIVKALDFFEERMGGAGSWEILVSVPDGLDANTQEKIAELSEKFRDLETAGGATITKVVSVTDGLDLIPSVAVWRARVSKVELLNQFQPEFIPSLYDEESQTLRIVLRSYEREDAEEKIALISEATSLAQTFDPQAQPTGTFLLLALIVDSLLSDQWTSCLLATVTIMLAMAVAFRSIRYGLISIIPNALPIVLILGGIGWLGIPVNMGTAMIASVSVGLTVDSSIHYLAGYRRARNRGYGHWDAMAAVHSETGRALVYAHVALVGGFSVLSMSNFVPVIYFGVLVSSAMIVGLFGDLVILPMLLTLAEQGRISRDGGSDGCEPEIAGSA